MHWAHAVSDDLIHWEYLPVALAPDQPYEDDFRGGCFSGSAIEKDGRLYLLYTASANGRQSQCVAWSDDGIHFEKYSANPVIAAPPEGFVPSSFRDPKVLEHEGVYYLVVGASAQAELRPEGCALLYRSMDLLHWDYVGVAARSGGKYGTMWECPDLFPLEDRWVMTFCPMQAKMRTCWMVGKMDFETGAFSCMTEGTLDQGWEFYAPQTFQHVTGRRIQLGWQSSWGDRVGNTVQEHWRWSMTVPRELSLGADGTLRVRPVQEVFEQSQDDGTVYHRRLTLRSGSITLWPRGRIGEDLYIHMERESGTFEVGRRMPDSTEWDIRSEVLPDWETELTVIADRNGIEIFANRGRLAISCVDLSKGEGLLIQKENASVWVDRK